MYLIQETLEKTIDEMITCKEYKISCFRTIIYKKDSMNSFLNIIILILF